MRRPKPARCSTRSRSGGQSRSSPRAGCATSPFSRIVDEAIDAATAWTAREPERAEAWFYLGAAYGARVQWRVLREERLRAARDGKRVKDSARARTGARPVAASTPSSGIGLYRYYADIAPAALRVLRWLLLLPGGDREERTAADRGRARRGGQLVRGEADYQLHLIYLWYEKRSRDALTLVRDLQRPLSAQSALLPDRSGDPRRLLPRRAASLAASTRSARRARRPAACTTPSSPSVRARLNIGHPARSPRRTAQRHRRCCARSSPSGRSVRSASPRARTRCCNSSRAAAADACAVAIDRSRSHRCDTSRADRAITTVHRVHNRHLACEPGRALGACCG